VGFVPVVALPAPAASASALPARVGGIIEIELSCGHRVRVDGAVDAQALARVIAVLQGR
jgi:transposase